jgi:hypothetical protein
MGNCVHPNAATRWLPHVSSQELRHIWSCENGGPPTVENYLLTELPTAKNSSDIVAEYKELIDRHRCQIRLDHFYLLETANIGSIR